MAGKHSHRILLIALLVFPAAAFSQTEDDPSLRFGLELKAHWRDSDPARFPSPFPFGPAMLPPGQSRGFLETVEEGSHAEVSVVTLRLEGRWSETWSGRFKVDLIDRYDRNPTSTGDEVDVDEAWIRWGREVEPGELPDRRGLYVKLGKLPEFERQDDRHLESYGLLGTVFNRFEDVGVELGVDLTRRLYFKASLTQGNPVFFRDPNALAGDNGIALFDGRVANPVPELQSGFPIFYETDADDLGFDHPELGFGLGLRHDSGNFAVDFLAWHTERDLAEEVDLQGTFYGGDLDLLLGPGNAFPLPVTGREKRETGANLWLYAGGFSLFGQVVDQDLAGLPRTGFEVEVAWHFDLPWLAGIAGRQLFAFVAPAVRYSELDPEFRTHPLYPAPSVMWDWQKLDLGLRLGIFDDVDLTVEWNDNTFVRAGRDESADEFLATLRLAFDWQR